MSQYAHLSKPDPEWAQFASKQDGDPFSRYTTLEQKREGFTQLSIESHKSWVSAYPKSGLKVEDIAIPLEGASITVRTYIPDVKVDEKCFPLLVWFHGGGFSLGDLEYDDPFLRLICVNNRVVCVNVEYRLAPEYPFPIPLNDCYDATRWAADNAESLMVDLSKGFMVGGPSAGGNLSAVVSLKARDDPSFKSKLTGQILQIPYLCPSPVYPQKWQEELLSEEQNKDGPILTTKDIKYMLGVYAPPNLTSPDIAPLLAQTHANLPPAYLQVCGADPLRDEAFLYEKILRESGVPTKFDVYPGLPHGFNVVAPLLTQSLKWKEDLQVGVEWLLHSQS